MIVFSDSISQELAAIVFAHYADAHVRPSSSGDVEHVRIPGAQIVEIFAKLSENVQRELLIGAWDRYRQTGKTSEEGS